jgi:hypothetical protein
MAADVEKMQNGSEVSASRHMPVLARFANGEKQENLESQ